jgi:hypothetical protein
MTRPGGRGNMELPDFPLNFPPASAAPVFCGNRKRAFRVSGRGGKLKV